MAKSLLDIKTILEDKLGVIPLWGDDFVPFTEKDIAKIQKAVGFEFPSDYGLFLKTYGCCSFNEMVGYEPLNDLPGEYTHTGVGLLTTFFGKKGADYAESNAIRWQLELRGDVLPAGMLPIAADGSGVNVICQNLKDDRKGVYFWYSEEDFDPDDYESGPIPDDILWRPLHKIAESFTDLIARLRPLGN